MKVGFIIYDGMTALDFVGAYDPVTRLNTMGFLPDLQWEVCARSMTVEDGAGLLSSRPKSASRFTPMT